MAKWLQWPQLKFPQGVLKSVSSSEAGRIPVSSLAVIVLAHLKLIKTSPRRPSERHTAGKCPNPPKEIIYLGNKIHVFFSCLAVTPV